MSKDPLKMLESRAHEFGLPLHFIQGGYPAGVGSLTSWPLCCTIKDPERFPRAVQWVPIWAWLQMLTKPTTGTYDERSVQTHKLVLPHSPEDLTDNQRLKLSLLQFPGRNIFRLAI